MIVASTFHGAYFQPCGCRSYSSGLYLIVLVLFYPYQSIHVMCVITSLFHPFKAETNSTPGHGAESLFRHPLCLTPLRWGSNI